MESSLESPIPVRFVFMLVGPSQSDMDYSQSGRAMGALMADWVSFVTYDLFNLFVWCRRIKALHVSVLIGVLSGGLLGPDGQRSDQRHR